jgi:hypothetical protein
MDIELGELREFIVLLCNAKNDTWNGLIRIHLKHPETDGNTLYEGTRIFALELDKDTTIAKISRGFDSIAANEDLTLKIMSKSLSQLPTHKLFDMIIRDDFRHSKEFKITQVLKGAEQEHAYIVTFSPKQRSKALRFSLAIEGELISPTLPKGKLSVAEIVRKNCLVLIAKNLNKGLSPVQVESDLRTLMGDKNIVSVYFPRAESGMHAGIANIKLLNTPIYKKFVKKTHKLQGKYVKRNPHPRSLDGSAAPSEATLKDLRFHDVNTALECTVKALENAITVPKKSGVAKDNITKLLKDAITKGNQSLKRELTEDMKTLREDILTEAHTYTDIMTQDLRTKIDGQFDNIDNQFKAVMESLSSSRKLLSDTPQRRALPSPDPSHSN